MSRHRIGGIVTLRRRELDRRGFLVFPGTTFVPCARCGNQVAMSPALHRVAERHQVRPYCYECVQELNPKGVRLVIDRGVLLEALTLNQLAERRQSELLQ